MSGPEPEPLPEDELEALLAYVAELRGVDFRDYRREPLERGVRARMEARGDGSVHGYRQRLLHDDAEVERLLEALVVPWSGFFRDPPLWQAMAQVVLPALLAAHPRRALRGWCVGAATGEEAWTIAMLLAAAYEAAGFPARAPAFRLVASDLDRRALEHARLGRYAAEAAAAVPATYRRFLVSEDGCACVAAELRDAVCFAYHDLLGRTLAPPEAVIASFELVLARNVLIYFDRRLQRKALERLAATLEPGAALVLGTVESMPPDLRPRFVPFAGVDPDLHVFRYVGP